MATRMVGGFILVAFLLCMLIAWPERSALALSVDRRPVRLAAAAVRDPPRPPTLTVDQVDLASLSG